MKILGTQTVEIEISERERKGLVLDYLREKFNFRKEFFIKDDKVFERVEYRSSHSWTEDEFRRDATPDDILIYSMINKIRSHDFVS